MCKSSWCWILEEKDPFPIRKHVQIFLCKSLAILHLCCLVQCLSGMSFITWYSLIIPIIFFFMQILTNGRYKACVHRVMTNCEELRASMPFTFGPHEEDLVAPLTRLLDHENPPLYQGVVFQDYMARAFNLNLPDSQKGLNFARAPSMSYSIPFAK